MKGGNSKRIRVIDMRREINNRESYWGVEGELESTLVHIPM
jgi:hypothetical protein